MLKNISFSELNNLLNQKEEIIFFGSGNITKKTLRKIPIEKAKCVVDNSKNLQGQTFEGLPIQDPSTLKKGSILIVICSTAVTDIATQLTELGFEANIDFCISPLLNDLLAIKDLEEINTTFYFTSGTMISADKEHGGGLYKCTVDGLAVSLHKIYSGPCYGAIMLKSEIYFVDTDAGLHSYSEKDGVKLLCELPEGSRAHGISYNKSNNKFYISCSYLDGVLEINENFEIERILKISNKLDILKHPAHHCNDNFTIDNSLYVSMFSSSGNWKLDSFDGCITEFDIESGEKIGNVVDGLYMPHNVKIFDGALHILDSLPGHLKYGNFSIQGTFPGFTRGLDYNNGLYYIGQSKNRNYSRVIGISNNVSIDCAVVIFNPVIKVSRTIQLPYTIGEIHAIVVV